MGYKYINNLATPENLKNFLELVDLAAGGGQDANNVFEIGRRLRNSPQMQLCIKAIKSDPASAQMVEEKYTGPKYDLDSMLKMPKGSLGWTYAKVISTMGYDPQFYPIPQSFEEDADYIFFRTFKTHDLHHILTGFSLDDFGELGVISVTVAQTRYPAFLFLDLLSLLMSFFTNDKLYSDQMSSEEQRKTLKYKFDLISAGIEMGQQAKPLFPIKWEEGFERSLDEWRKELNIKPVVEGPYSWYSHQKLKAAIA